MQTAVTDILLYNRFSTTPDGPADLGFTCDTHSTTSVRKPAMRVKPSTAVGAGRDR